MKIAIPSETDAGLESIRSGHFGHAAYMTVVEFDDDMNIVGVESVKNADHDAVGCGGVIDFVSGIGVDGILTVGMGMPPFTRFTNAGIKVYSDTTEPTSVTWPACSRRARSRSWIPPTPAATREGLGPQRPRGTCPIARPARRAADSSGFCFGLNAPGR